MTRINDWCDASRRELSDFDQLSDLRMAHEASSPVGYPMCDAEGYRQQTEATSTFDVLKSISSRSRAGAVKIISDTRWVISTRTTLHVPIFENN